MPVLEWRDPPPSWRVFNPEICAELRARPGVWALIRVYENTNNKTAGENIHHPDDIQTVVRTRRGPNGQRWTELYARAKEVAS